MEKGLVIRSTGSWYSVKTETGKVIDCRIKSKFRMKGIRTTNPVAVGDKVKYTVEENASHNIPGVITEIEERRNYIIRKASNLSKESQIIAANIDQAFLIITIKDPATLPGFIDRFLVTTEAYRIPASLVINKLDIYNEKDYQKLEEYLWTYEEIGYKCYQVSAEKNFNIDALREVMRGKINVLSGHSGVGKSSIINRLDPELDLKTAQISDYHRQGKHTTTFSEMFEMPGGGYLIDTPGIRGFGVIDMEKEEISHFFPEIFKLLKECRYHNCTHIHEPGCAVKAALEAGEIPVTRYESYLSMVLGEDSKHRPDIWK
ncbi:ribosome small subunit-dependent GTPase A [Prolixibacter sp. SD074]|uniref:ribosome small subunit-dependent GTPase A n=1 Tax=Prolixibacter sp. SD074 TaxID=2652391 RepID=UPI0012993D6C|nr:ribosome small subunit-dependent GTPase A [Prolixibacter sp. SD074]